MNISHLFLRVIIVVSFSPLFLHAIPTLAQLRDGEVCNIELVQSLLIETQVAQQNGKLEEAQELVATVIDIIEEISQNCSLEPVIVEEPTAIAEDASALGASFTDKEDGFYLVGIDIAPGRWETTGKGSDCYWARLDISGNIIANNFGYAGGTVTIQDTDFQLEFDGCGTVVYVEDREKILFEDASAPKESGFYTVGIEIASGLWRSTGTGDGCYVARLDENQETIDNHFGSAGITVSVQPTDYEVEFNDCGTWEYLGKP